MVTSQSAPDVFQAVADSTRRAILDRLRYGGQPVGEIARHFPISRPAVSKHLRVLLDARLVWEEREGQQRIYRLNSHPLERVDQWLEGYRTLWATKLQRLEAPTRRHFLRDFR